MDCKKCCDFLQEVTIIAAPVCADKNGLFIFSGRKRQRGKLVRVDQQINARQTA